MVVKMVLTQVFSPSNPSLTFEAKITGFCLPLGTIITTDNTMLKRKENGFLMWVLQMMSQGEFQRILHPESQQQRSKYVSQLS